MQVISTVQDLLEARADWTAFRTVGLVPTMGYLHAGHLSLVRQARQENTLVAVSIFVNPTQFGPQEDLARYPRDLPRDLQMLEACGADLVFTPAPSDIYPPGFATFVDPGDTLAHAVEGASRPGHFRGMATIVLKLFELFQPQYAYFGQKDAQQAAIVARMIKDFHLPLLLRVLPTLREADGLAMSSRNSYLAPETRAAAPVLYQALLAGQRVFESLPPEGPAAVSQAMREVIATTPLARLDYAEIRDPETFLPLETLRAPALLLLAVSFGSTRLLDNFLLRPDGTWDTGLIHV